MLQQLRLLLAAAADVGESELRIAPHRDDVLRADEDGDLAGLEIGARPARSRCSTMKSDEPYSSIFGRWWPFCASSMASS